MADRIGEATTLGQRIRHLMENELRVGADEGCFCCQFEFDGDGWKGCNQHGYLDDGRKGDYAYVGTEYGGASVAGKPARILFVSMDRPGEERHWTFEHVQAGYRHAARIRGNPHMGGVDVEMEHLVDGGTSPDERCNQFALVNSVLCGPPPARNAKDKDKPLAISRSTGTMRTQCQQHTKRIIRELEPDIVIAQGEWPRDSVRGLLVDPQQIGDRWANQMSGQQHRWVELWRGSIEGGKPLLALLTSHPANYPGFRWKTGGLPDELNLGIQRTREAHAKTSD